MATSAERLQQYEDLFNQSQAYNPTKFQQDFEKSYGETTGYNQDLINQQSQALGSLQSVAPELRQRYSQTLIKDPTLQRSLIAQARQAPIADYNTAVGLLGQRGQRYSDILGKATAGYETSAQQAQTAAENAWRLYQDQLAQEEAARVRAQQENTVAKAIQDYIDSQKQNELDITVDETGGNSGGNTSTAKPMKWTDKLYNSPILGRDLYNEWDDMNTLGKITSFMQPLTGIKTFSGLLGRTIADRRAANNSRSAGSW